MAKIGLYPTGGHLVKRVIGVAGDTIECCDDQGRLIVNGKPLDEGAYVKRSDAKCNGPMSTGGKCDEEWTVGPIPEGHIFVMGDNRSRSADSSQRCAARRDRVRARRRVRAGRPGRRQGLRAALARRPLPLEHPSGHVRGRAGPVLVSGSTMTAPSPLPAPAQGSVTVRRDAGLYGYERALRRAGLEPIAGVDEAGRGACAGPLVAGAVVLPAGRAGIVPGLADSKLLTEAARERVYAQVVRRALAWSVVVIDSEECDRLGMHVANLEALRRAVARLGTRPSYVLTDGFPVDGLGVPGLAVWKGDRVAACIAAASVVAKVTRDRLMVELDGTWPAYDFRAHKGYVTDDHEAALAEHGPCPVHRMRFVNVRRAAGSEPFVPEDAATRVGRAGQGRATGGRMSAEDLEKYETEMELTLYREYRDVGRHLQVRRRDRPPLLPVQPGRREGALGER